MVDLNLKELAPERRHEGTGTACTLQGCAVAMTSAAELVSRLAKIFPDLTLAFLIRTPSYTQHLVKSQ